MKSCLYLFVLVCFQPLLYAQHANGLDMHLKQVPTETDNLFEARFFAAAGSYDLAWLQLDPTALDQRHLAAPDHLNLSTPHDDTEVVLELVRVNITTPSFVVTDQDDRVLSANPSRHYRGVLAGHPGAIAALSVFPDEVIGVVAAQATANLVLGRDQQHAGGQTYVFYREVHAKKNSQYLCPRHPFPPKPSPRIAPTGSPRHPSCLKLTKRPSKNRATLRWNLF